MPLPTLSWSTDPLPSSTLPNLTWSGEAKPATHPSQVPDPTEGLASKVLGMGGSVIDTIGNVLGVPQQLLFRGIEQLGQGVQKVDWADAARQSVAPLTEGAPRLSGEDLLAQQGMPEGWGRWVAGLGTDFLADPLNATGIGAVKSAIKASAPVRAAGALSDTVMMNPAVAKALRPFAKVGPREYRRDKYLFEAQKRAGVNQSVHDVVQASRPALEHGGVTAMDQVALRLGGKAPSAGDASIEAAVQNLKKLTDEWNVRDVAAGTRDPEAYRSQYMPRVSKKQAAVELGALGEDSPFVISNPHAKPQAAEMVEGVEYIKDPLVALATRGMRGQIINANVNFIRSSAQKFGAISEAPVEGMRQLTVKASGLPFQAELSKMWFPEIIADDLEYMLTHRYELGDVGKVNRALNQVWKTYTTTLNPAFHGTNAIGNVMQMMTIGRMNPLKIGPRLTQAGRVMSGKGVAERIGAYTGAEAEALARQYGITGVEFGQFSNLSQDITDLMRAEGLPTVGRETAKPIYEKASDALTKNKAVRTMTDLGGFVENRSRMALFLDGLARGLSPDDAAILVRDTLFDYSELPDAIRKTRDLWAPYITWMYKNLPAQTKMLFTAPERAATAPKLKNAMRGEEGETYTDEQLPQFARDRGMVDTGLTSTEGAHLVLDPNMPAQDLELFQSAMQALSRLKGGDVAGAAQAGLKTGGGLLGQVGPIPRMLFEGISGQELRSGRELWPEHSRVQMIDPTTGQPVSLPTTRTRAPYLLGAIDELTGQDIFTTKGMTSAGEMQREMDPFSAWAVRGIPGMNILNQVGRAGVGLRELAGEPDTGQEALEGSGDTLKGIPLPLIMALQRLLTGTTPVAVTPAQAGRNQAFLQREAEAMQSKAMQTKARQDMGTAPSRLPTLTWSR